jgi:hypothetical protein
MVDYEKGDIVEYARHLAAVNISNPFPVGLVVDVEYLTKSDDFLVHIMWSDADRPQALYQKDCHNRGLRIMN